MRRSHLLKSLADDGEVAAAGEEVAAVFEIPCGRGVVGRKPAPQLNQTMPVGGQAGSGVGGGEQHIEGVFQKLSGCGVAEAGIGRGRQYAVFGNNEGDVSVTSIIHPLSEISDALLYP